MFHVKPQNDTFDYDAATLSAILRQVSVSASDEQADLLIRHARSVVEANQTMNLTRITEARAVVELHIVDSLAFLPRVEVLASPVVDLGSGAGYPGIPLAVMGLDVRLCESVKKKAAFLERCTTELGVECDVLALRAEELAASEPMTAGTVVARAVSSLPSLVELATPVLRMGGRLVALKGAPSREEFERADRVAKMCGMQQYVKVQYQLPAGEQRTVVGYERVGRSRVDLPRRCGLAQREPLG